VRTHLALATLRLQLATADAGDGGVTPSASSSAAAAASSGSTQAASGADGGAGAWDELRQSYLRAAAAARSAALGRSGGHAGSVWALALLGVARTAWARGDAAEAEAVLAEANCLDNQVRFYHPQASLLIYLIIFKSISNTPYPHPPATLRPAPAHLGVARIHVHLR
jgi:hypothetical protein